MARVELKLETPDRGFIPLDVRRYATGGFIPRIDDYFEFGSSRGFDGVAIPALAVPTAPAEPAVEPESASVQMLRKIVDDRTAEKGRAEARRISHVASAEYYERAASELRATIEQDDRHIAAADASIAEVEADIAKLTASAA